MAPMTKTVPAPNNAGRSTLDTWFDSRQRLHAVGSLGVQPVPCLLGAEHARPIGNRGGHGASQGGGRSLKEVHEQGGLRITLLHE